jgi:hypothetical protein
MYAKLIQPMEKNASCLTDACTVGLEPIDAKCDMGGIPTWN